MKDSTAFLAYILIVGIGILISSKAFSYCLMIFFHRDAHWAIDIIAGLILSEICIPIALVAWILKALGVV